MEGPPYPKAQPNASRRDAYPPEGGPQGSSLSFMQQQHLDPNNVALGVLNPLDTGQGIRNHDLSAAICSAINDWQIDKWTSKDQPPERLGRGRQRGRPGGGRRNPQARRRQEFRAGAAAQPQCRAARASAATGRSTRRRKRRGFRSASTPSASAAIRSPRRAGRAITSRRWSAIRSASRPRSPASCWRACSSGIRN